MPIEGNVPCGIAPCPATLASSGGAGEAGREIGEGEKAMDLRQQVTIRPEQASIGKWRRLRREVAVHRFLLLMLVPGFVYFVVFQYLPMYGILVAFKDFRLNANVGYIVNVFTSSWAGLKHFIVFVESPNFWKLLRNTILLSVYNTIFGFPAPILFAILLNEVRHLLYKKVIQTVSYLPYFISTVAVVGMLKMLLSPESGAINNILGALFGIEPKYYFGDADWFRTLFVTSDIWQKLGWGSIIYLAALSKVNPEMYESAVIDGARRSQQIWHITLPALKTTIVVMLLLSLSGLLDVGVEKVLLMYSPATYETADVLSTYIYRRGLVDMSYSFGTAVELFNGVVNLLILVGANYASRKLTSESLW
ncbi:ABC transporter permease subunit [Paenibacillus sp.]|uniref:ABC transporter permease n=1 Tax=Paenibacillus sp. TaxID=58172 RepID=UPI002811C728|nr:ABC transporter permease subunit [Paenibacillus sp.]